MYMHKTISCFLGVVILFAGCNGIRNIKNDLANLTPYERYVQNLEKAGLNKRPMVQEWIDAGQDVMQDSIVVPLPFTETGYFLSHRPEARSYRFSVHDGQVLTVNGALKVTSDAKVFADLFLWKDDEWKSVATSDSSLTLSYEFSRNSECLLRIQPELLVNAYYSVSIALTPVLINPVSGADNRSIQSFYGASRDGGKRSHEGVDIFAKKGTLIVAPTKGRISRVGTSKLGGKVVWMYDQQRGHSYYFAHLDSQYVHAGQFVKQGDAIGTVGNTGNARRTPPHLHFGIYQAGSKDPLSYIKTLDAIAELSPVDTTFREAPFKIISKNSSLRSGPSSQSPEIFKLKPETYVNILAQTKDHYRVALADDSEGFVLKGDVGEAEKGVAQVMKSKTDILVDPEDKETVIRSVEPNTSLETLASFREHIFVRTADGIEGWIQKVNELPSSRRQ
jgi:peptidoglycan LD-endopeptidase LytH